MLAGNYSATFINARARDWNSIGSSKNLNIYLNITAKSRYFDLLHIHEVYEYNARKKYLKENKLYCLAHALELSFINFHRELFPILALIKKLTLAASQARTARQKSISHSGLTIAHSIQSVGIESSRLHKNVRLVSNRLLRLTDRRRSASAADGLHVLA